MIVSSESSASASRVPPQFLAEDLKHKRERTEQIKEGISVIVQRYLPHPLATGMTAENALRVSQHFLAISLGFPYAMAGSQREVMTGFIERNEAPDSSIECTTAVGNFLTWDEVGGHQSILQSGMAGLSSILKTERFHGNLLKADLETIFGAAVKPEFSITGAYLNRLCDQLSNANAVRRCAAFVAFERHAELVITAFWNRLSDLFGLNKTDFRYFDTHIGEDDPAEFYHIQMTESLIEQLAADRPDEFLAAFEECLKTHLQWATDISAS